jgi:hypothetical protein
MHFLLAVALLLAAPFWEAKPVRQWTKEELAEIFTSSPWVANLSIESRGGSAPPVSAYLASARPMREAEEESIRRHTQERVSEQPGNEEYRDFIRENDGKVIVLAVALPDAQALAHQGEVRRMEDESFLRAGKKKHKLLGHFPPAPADPYLRLIFPRALGAEDRKLRFELYLPSAPMPYRTVEFDSRDLVWKGRAEM